MIWTNFLLRRVPPAGLRGSSSATPRPSAPHAASAAPPRVTLPAEHCTPSTFRSKKRSSTVRSIPPRTPEAVDGRRHIDIQTDVYLEELTDTVPESDNHTQTDAFLDRPPTPLFVPQKTGLDATTQIATGEALGSGA